MRAVFTVLVASVLAVWGTWPLAAHLKDHVYNAEQSHGSLGWFMQPDVYLTAWILAWDQHALTTAPLSLFDANIFYPTSQSLAFTDHLLGALPVYFPLAIVSGDPVFAHQATLLLTFAFAFLAVLLLVHDWTASWPAAVLAGALYAFSPLRATHLTNLQLEGDYFLPLIPFVLQRVLARRSARWGAALAVVLVLQSLHSYYLGYAAFVAVAAVCMVVLPGDGAAHRHGARVAVPVVIAALVTAVISLPYLSSRRSGIIQAMPADSLRVGSLRPGATRVGLLALALACAAAMLWRRGVRARVSGAWVLSLVAVGLCGYGLALGPEFDLFGRTFVGPYVWLAKVVPGFDAIRAPYRFEALLSMSASTLAGVAAAGGLRWWRAHVPTELLRCGMSAAVLAVAAWSVGHFVDGPLALRPIETRATLPAAYRWLASAPPGAVLELPFTDFGTFIFDREREARRTYLSIYHWHPIASGYSGYRPPTYRLLAAMAARLPDPKALRDVAHLASVRYVVVDERQSSLSARAAWEKTDLPRIGFGDQTIYLLPVEPGEVRPALARPPREWGGRTPDGVPLVPLVGDDQHSALRHPDVPEIAWSGVAAETWIVVENRGQKPWPGIALPGMGGVALAVRIADRDGRRVPVLPVVTPLGVDVMPGERVRTPLWYIPPETPGEYALEAYLIQDGVGPFDALSGGSVQMALRVVKPS